ncbi:MAG: hypothetical protein RL322_1665 [Pseudomonadota bacterium]|jgi:uncharacterized protein
MKLHADATPALNTVTAYGPGFIEVNRERHTGAILLMPEDVVRAWPVASIEALNEAVLRPLLEFAPEIILLGTGERQRMLPPRLAGVFVTRGLGLDAMDTRAACRTYNILMTEGRRVLAALLPI